MTDNVCACGGHITEVTSNNRLLYAKTSQELTATNTKATYRWITNTKYALALFPRSGQEVTSATINHPRAKGAEWSHVSGFTNQYKRMDTQPTRPHYTTTVASTVHNESQGITKSIRYEGFFRYYYVKSRHKCCHEKNALCNEKIK